MKIKHYLPLILSLFVTLCIFSQEQNKCETIAEKTFQAIDSNSPDILFPYLAEDFTISGQKGRIAKGVIQQLISQLSINSYEKQKIVTDEESSKIFYSVEYKGLGTKQSIFIFNENCELKTLELFKMEVKVLNEGETKIEKPSDNFIKIPFEMAGNLIAVKVLLNGEEKTFILDSGSPRVLLNSAHISSGEKKTTISSAKGVTDNNISGMDIQNDVNLNFGGIQINNQKIVTLNLSHLEQGLNTDIFGLIGYEMIKDYDVYIDYEKRILTLIKPDFFDSFQKNNLRDIRLVSIPLTMRGHIPVLEVQIDGKKLNFGVDTGAEANLIENSLFSSLEEQLHDIKTDDLWGADKISTEIKSGNLKRMILNGKTFKDVKTVFTNINHLNRDKELKIQGLIGFPILSRQKTIISFKREEILFEE